MAITINKAVFPVAGLGTRFLPATKANPKEMLPIVDKPLIQYAVEEAISAGITQLIFVTSASKRAIEDHFDTNYELEQLLQARGKHALLSVVREIIPAGISCVYIRQNEPLGLGHAVLCARPLIGNEPFAVLLADDLIDQGNADKICLSAMVATATETNSSVIAVEEVVGEQVEKYGIVALAEDGRQDACRIQDIIEKPSRTEAPSNLAVVGRYILTPQIFTFLAEIEKNVDGEVQLTDAIAKLLHTEPVFAYPLIGRRYDCGSRSGYLQATVDFALKHPQLKQSFRHYLQRVVEEL